MIHFCHAAKRKSPSDIFIELVQPCEAEDEVEEEAGAEAAEGDQAAVAARASEAEAEEEEGGEAIHATEGRGAPEAGLEEVLQRANGKR